jgi:long-chain acyl-CoA synthetase
MAFQINDCDARFAIVMTMFYALVKGIQAQTKVERVIVTNVKEYLAPPARILFTLAREKKEGHRLTQIADGDRWWADLLKEYDGRKPSVTVRSSDLALLQYTGGTTGVSKGAMASHAALVANTLQIIAWTNVSEGELANADRSKFVFLGALPMFHVFGLLVMLSQAMSTGASVVLVPNARDIDNVVEVVHHYKPTVFLGVPALFNAVNNHPRVKSGEVRFHTVQIAQSGAAPLPAATKREFEAAGARILYEGYGMSEMPTATHSNPIIGTNKVGSVGMPLPDVEARIVSLDDGESELAVGEIGEIIMRGPNMMTGYYKMPTETANTLRDHDGRKWVYSGDIGYMDADGYFVIVDRKKDMALIGGFNVYPTTVEKVLKEHPAVLEVGVASVPHDEKDGQEMLKAWIVVKPGMTVTAEELIAHCKPHLAPYEVPRRYGFIAELPKTMIGKTLRRELVQMELAEREKSRDNL